MKKEIALRIRCEDCKVVYDIPNDERYDDYMIIYRLGETKNGMPVPHLYCPQCLERGI